MDLQNITPQTYEELIELDTLYFKLSEAMGIMWMSSKRRSFILQDIRRGNCKDEGTN